MASTFTRTCDRRLDEEQVCGKDVKASFLVSVGGHWLTADLCPEHREEEETQHLQAFMDRTGAVITEPPTAQNSAKRKTYWDSKNGVWYTAEDVRRYLQSRGQLETTTGRVSEAMIAAFEARDAS